MIAHILIIGFRLKMVRRGTRVQTQTRVLLIWADLINGHWLFLMKYIPLRILFIIIQSLTFYILF